MLRLLISDKYGKIFTHPALEGVGMEAGHFFRLKSSGLVRLPPSSRLFMLPDRMPVGVDDYYAVAAFLPPGYTVTFNSAYQVIGRVKPLPLFSYAAVVSYKGALHAAAVRIDKDRRHDATLINIASVRKNIKKFKKIFGHNRLIPHLEECALCHGCPNAQNFFLQRYEAPLPASPACNAACAGCISKASSKDILPSQPRIKFSPDAEELSEIALFHIKNVRNAVVSFGQGCEGEPLLAGSVIEKAIRRIRAGTSGGTININTNGSRPEILAALFDAGLDSCRISLNSSRGIYYDRYYRPKGYSFKDVMASIGIAKRKGGFVSLNYLVMPGLTDWSYEVRSLKQLVRKHNIDMIQWRNLNFDPLLYFRILKIRPQPSQLIGIRETINQLRKEFPRLRMGYFNPASPRVTAFRHR